MKDRRYHKAESHAWLSSEVTFFFWLESVQLSAKSLIKGWCPCWEKTAEVLLYFPVSMDHPVGYIDKLTSTSTSLKLPLIFLCR